MIEWFVILFEAEYVNDTDLRMTVFMLVFTSMQQGKHSLGLTRVVLPKYPQPPMWQPRYIISHFSLMDKPQMKPVGESGAFNVLDDAAVLANYIHAFPEHPHHQGNIDFFLITQERTDDLSRRSLLHQYYI